MYNVFIFKIMLLQFPQQLLFLDVISDFIEDKPTSDLLGRFNFPRNN